MSANAVKTMTLRLPALSGWRHFALDDLAESGELGVTRRADLLRRREERGQAVAVLDEVLPPADAVHVLEQHLDLAPDQQALESRIVHVHVLDVDLFHRLRVGFDLGQRGLHVGKLAREREGKGSDRTLHPLQDVHPQQVDEAFFAVHLAEEALAAANLSAVLGVVGRLLVRQDVAQRRIGREVEAADFVVDFADGAELAGEVHVGLDVDGLQSLRESARFVRCRSISRCACGSGRWSAGRAA